MSKYYGNGPENFELDEAGDYYIRHADAMTREGLHSKGDIARELGYRDMMLDRARDELEQVTAQRDALSNTVSMQDDLLNQYNEGLEQMRGLLRAARERLEDGWEGSLPWKIDQALAETTKGGSACNHEPGADCPEHPITEYNQRPVSEDRAAEIDRALTEKGGG